MDGWIGWMDGKMNGCLDGETLNGGTMHGWMDGRTDRPMDGRIDSFIQLIIQSISHLFKIVL